MNQNNFLKYYKKLNSEQKEAVNHSEGKLLLVAGAGSGKTSVLTTRIARLINEGVGPEKILAITFTNKAANEMMIRAKNLEPKSAYSTITTFHGLALQLLKKYGEAISLAFPLEVVDPQENKALITKATKKILKSLNFDVKAFNQNFEFKKPLTQQNIVKCIEIILENADMKTFVDEQMFDIYSVSSSYFTDSKFIIEKINTIVKRHDCQTFPNEAINAFFNMQTKVVKNILYFYFQSKNTVDEYGKVNQSILTFEDLQIYLYMLFKANPEIGNEISEKYEYIHVDEYQDTSLLQSELIHELQEVHGNLFIVGDPDQAIYQWRGASIENILTLKEKYPDLIQKELKTNYRSKKEIVNFANTLIKKNVNRIDKLSKANDERQRSNTIVYKKFHNGYGEADHIIDEIKRVSLFDHNYKRFCVMYRNKELSTILERQLFEENIPYRKLNGSNTSINERVEAKEMLAFMTLLINPESVKSYERIANKPAKGITPKLIESIEEESQNSKITFTQAAFKMQEENSSKGLNNFTELISLVQIYSGLLHSSSQESPSEIVFSLAKDSGYLNYNLETMMENLSDRKKLLLLNDFNSFLYLKEEEKVLTAYYLSLLQKYEYDDELQSYNALEILESFVEKQELDDTDGQDSKARETKDNKVTFTTIHSAKGLEFEYIYMIGMEQGIFPKEDAISNAFQGKLQLMEEERNVMYVGITRAMKKLTISHVDERVIYGKKEYYEPSQFIKEMGLEIPQEEGMWNV